MISFKFRGFTPSQELEQLTKQALWGIEKKAPFLSRLHATMEKENGVFSANIRICHENGNFNLAGKDPDPVDLVKKLQNDFRFEIKSWRKHRKIA